MSTSCGQLECVSLLHTWETRDICRPAELQNKPTSANSSRGFKPTLGAKMPQSIEHGMSQLSLTNNSYNWTVVIFPTPTCIGSSTASGTAAIDDLDYTALYWPTSSQHSQKMPFPSGSIGHISAVFTLISSAVTPQKVLKGRAGLIL